MFLRQFAALVLGLLAGNAMATEPNPWTLERIEAVVRLETLYPGYPRPGISTGFILATPGRYYAVVSTHSLKNEYPADPFNYKPPGSDGPKEQCLSIEGITSLVIKRGEGKVETLQHDSCVIHREHDISLIPLSWRPGGYPSLRMLARPLLQRDRVYLAGYANGLASLDTVSNGPISQFTDPPDELAVAYISTLPGMSGGPFLWVDGSVVGLHRGGLQYFPTRAHFTRVEKARTTLEPIVGPIDVDTADHSPPLPPDDVLAQQARIGDMLALAQVESLSERVRLWEEFQGRKVTKEEIQMFELLPVKVSTDQVDSAAQLINASASGDRVELAQQIQQGAAQERASCWGEEVSIADGLLMCDSKSVFIPGAKQGKPMEPRFIVMHYAGTIRMDQVVKFMTAKGGSSSTHFVIDRDGSIVQLVPTTRTDGRAERAEWRGTAPLSAHSITIELVNAGRLRRRPDGQFGGDSGKSALPENEVEAVGAGDTVSYWHRYTAAQMQSAESLAKAIKKAHPIESIIGHCSYATPTFADPGPAFPLRAFGEAILGVGHGVDDCPVNNLALNNLD